MATTADKQVEALGFFLKPYAVDLFVMTEQQRQAVPGALLVNLRDAATAGDDLLRRRALYATEALVSAGAKAVWERFMAVSVRAQVTT